MDKYNIDSHKLIYHIDRVHDWLNGKQVPPIYMEISPAGACNHRCVYCGLDFMEYKSRQLDANILKERISELAGMGLKSIMYAGEGEPFLHKAIADITRHTEESGIDCAITTNGALFDKDLADSILADTKWIKVGVDAANKATYADIHRCKPDDFDKVIKNMSYAAKLKRDNGYACTLGFQLLLLPENSKEVIELAKLAKDIGMDYLIVKPYSQHPQSKTTRYSSIKYADYEKLSMQLAELDTEEFNTIFRFRAMEKWDKSTRSYSRCLSLPFWSYIDAGGNVWGCSIYLGDERFFYGNIYESSFKDIWQGEKRAKSLSLIEKNLDVSECRVNCRMDEINRYLWDLKNPAEHVNFI